MIPSHKGFAIILGCCVTLLVGDTLLGRYNALEVCRALRGLLWAFLYPAMVLALLYYFFIVHPRWVRDDVEFQWNASRPVKWILFVLGALFLPALVTFMVQSCLVGAMDTLNENPKEIEAMVTRFDVGKRHKCNFRIHVSYQGNHDIELCIDELQPIETVRQFQKTLMKDVWPLKRGEKVVLVGRKSWAGIVIDEIRPVSYR